MFFKKKKKFIPFTAYDAALLYLSSSESKLGKLIKQIENEIKEAAENGNTYLEVNFFGFSHDKINKEQAVFLENYFKEGGYKVFNSHIDTDGNKWFALSQEHINPFPLD